MHLRALTEYEKAMGPDHTSTLNSVRHSVEAQEMFKLKETG